MPRRLSLLAVVLLHATALAQTDPLVAEAQVHAQEAIAQSRSPRGAASLFRLNALREDLGELSLLARTYSAILDERSADHFTRTLARMLWVDVERSRGNLNRAADIARPLGFINDYYVLGGFENDGKSGCDVDYGPEAALDLAAQYPSRGRSLGWHKLTVKPLDGFTDLGTALRPNREVVAYALTFLEASADARVNLGLGASGAFKLWVNGQLAAHVTRDNTARPDQSRIAVKLKRGINRVLLKVCHDTGALGFYLRQEKGEGPLPQVVLPDSLPPVLKEKPQGTVLTTLTTALKARVDKAPKDAALRADYAAVLWHVRAFDAKEHTAAQEAERAAKAAPKDVRLQYQAALFQEDDVNARRALLESALAAEPGHVPSTLLLANHELRRNHPERVLPLLAPLISKYPTLGTARLVLARAYEALGEMPRSAMLVEQAFREAPRTPSLVRDAAGLARRNYRHEEALQRLRVALALRFDDLLSRKVMASLLADTARIDEATEELGRILRLDPFDNSARLQLAELLASNERFDAAQAIFAQARDISPDDHDLHERWGRALLQQGKRTEALAELERALVLRPQNPALKEVLRSLKGEDVPWGSQYALEVKALARSPEAQALSREDVVSLVDLTYVRVQPTGLSSRFQQIAVKVNTPRGVESFRNYPISYSPNRQEVRVLRSRITKPDGAVVESFGDTERNLNEPWSGMYYDARARVLSFPALGVGDVLELQFRLDDTAQENLLSDYWGDVDYVQTATARLRYVYLVDMPSGRDLYWNSAQLASRVTYSKEDQKDGRVLHRWTANNVAKVVPEPGMPGWAEVVTTLHVSTYKTWEQVGRYWWSLVKDQLVPNDELRKTTESTLKGVNRKDELAVIRAIYDFVVTNTRYVALEFGIHGFKPYRVDRVLARRFGDCKDKASLIHAMLKVAGVDSRLVLLRMRHLGNLPPEPASLAAFNHAIAYVPKYQLFLDGTAEFHGSRELPAPDRLANVLVVEPSAASAFLTTPEAKPEENTVQQTMALSAAKDGSARSTGFTAVQGVSAPDYRRSYQAVGTRKSTLEQAWSQAYPGVQVEKVSVSDSGKLEQPFRVDYGLSIPRFAEVLPAGLRFYPLGTGRQFTQAFAALPSRKFDLVLSDPWKSTSHVEVTLPPGYELEALPENVGEETPFGRYSVKHQKVDGKLVTDGEVEFTTSRVKASDYVAFRGFLQRVDQALSRKTTVNAPSGTTASR
jgi:cellulose synthase operon protein C